MAFIFKVKTGATAVPNNLETGEFGYAAAGSANEKHLFVGNGSGVSATKFYNAGAIDAFLAAKSNTGHSHVITDVTGLQTALDSKVPNTRTVSGANGLSGGGALTSDLIISHATVARTDSGTAGASKAVTDVTTDVRGHITGVVYTDFSATFAPYNASGYVSKAGDETISGVKTFSSLPKVPTTTPTESSHVASKAYVDSVAQGLHVKAAVRAATTANIALTGSGDLTVDGIGVLAGERVLVKNQTTASQNGIYIVDPNSVPGTSYALLRADDMAAGTDANSDYVFVNLGTLNGNTGWVVTGPDTSVDATVTVGTDAMTWTQFTGAGSFDISTDGSILTDSRSGNTWTITHSTSAGYKHLPAGGAAAQFVKYSADGTGAWNYLPLTFNGNAHGSGYQSFSWYAPTTAGSSGQILVSNGSGAPSWTGTIDCGNY